MPLQNFLKCIPSSSTEPVDYAALKKLIQKSSPKSWNNIDPENNIKWDISTLRFILALATCGHDELLPNNFKTMAPYIYKNLSKSQQIDLAREYFLGYVKIRPFMPHISFTPAPVKATHFATPLRSCSLFTGTERQPLCPDPQSLSTYVTFAGQELALPKLA